MLDSAITGAIKDAVDAAFVLIQGLKELEVKWNEQRGGQPHYADHDHPINFNVGKIEGGDSVFAWVLGGGRGDARLELGEMWRGLGRRGDGEQQGSNSCEDAKCTHRPLLYVFVVLKGAHPSISFEDEHLIFL